jgi:hypothetical protein
MLHYFPFPRAYVKAGRPLFLCFSLFIRCAHGRFPLVSVNGAVVYLHDTYTEGIHKPVFPKNNTPRRAKVWLALSPAIAIHPFRTLSGFRAIDRRADAGKLVCRAFRFKTGTVSHSLLE